MQSFQTQRAIAFRITPAAADPGGVLQSLLDDTLTVTSIAGGGYVVPAEQRDQLTHHPAVTQGWVYLQNAASQLAAPALDPQPGHAVLDLAAAPGGKTLHLAELMQCRGELAAVEPSRPRFFRMQQVLETCLPSLGARETHWHLKRYQTDGRGIGAKTPLRFDRVLLDAPCSAEARLHPNETTDWSIRRIKRCAALQAQLLASALAACRPGGVVLYATCTLAPEENEAVVSAALAKAHGGIAVEHIALPDDLVQTPAITMWSGDTYDSQIQACVRVLPDATLYPACFMARLRVLKPQPPLKVQPVRRASAGRGRA